MQSILRASRLAASPSKTVLLRPLAQPQRVTFSSSWAQNQGKSPQEQLEHPGPPPPDTGGASKQSASQSSQASTSSSNTGSTAGPKIYHPRSAAEKDDPEVRKHNEEMRHRSEQSVNQLSEEDNLVDKKFWKGE